MRERKARMIKRKIVTSICIMAIITTAIIIIANNSSDQKPLRATAFEPTVTMDKPQPMKAGLFKDENNYYLDIAYPAYDYEKFISLGNYTNINVNMSSSKTANQNEFSKYLYRYTDIHLRKAIVDAIAKNSTIYKMPPSLIDFYTHKIAYRIQQQNEKEKRKNRTTTPEPNATIQPAELLPEQLLNDISNVELNQDQYNEELILHAIGTKENLTITEKQYRTIGKQWATNLGYTSLERFYQEYGESYVHDDIYLEYVIYWLTNQSA